MEIRKRTKLETVLMVPKIIERTLNVGISAGLEAVILIFNGKLCEGGSIFCFWCPVS